MFISILYMFRTVMCPSSGELIVSIRHLVYVIVCRWPSGMQEHMLLHTRRSSCWLITEINILLVFQFISFMQEQILSYIILRNAGIHLAKVSYMKCSISLMHRLYKSNSKSRFPKVYTDWLFCDLVSRSYDPNAPRPYLMDPLCPTSIYGSPVTLLNFQTTPELYS